MILNIIFVVTLGITILNLIKLIGLMFGNTITLPFRKFEYITFSFDIWWVLIPSYFYQVYWWSQYFNLLTI
jgi:hypothetical protein